MARVNLVWVVMFLVGTGQWAFGHDGEHLDQLKVAVQRICPVSGRPLGSMGPPIKAQVGEESVYLCCRGCVGKQVSPDHWARIHANFASAQRLCPVMEEPLGDKAKWTVVRGQIIYVCCPGCLEEIAGSPERYLRKVGTLYAQSLRTGRAAR